MLLSAPPVSGRIQKAGSWLTAVQGQVRELQIQLQQARQEQDSWQRQLGEAEQRVGQLQGQVKHLQEGLQEARDEAAESKSQAGRLRDQVSFCGTLGSGLTGSLKQLCLSPIKRHQALLSWIRPEWVARLRL